MKNIRVTARLDIKGENLVKGIQLEGLRKLGKPNEFAKRYYEDGADELIFIDIVASLYNRNSILPIIEKASEDIFVPLTVGGGIRSVDDATKALNAGADKVAINTAAIKRPALIKEVAETFGSQCMVINIEAKKTVNGDWECLYDNGREHSKKSVANWVQEAIELGAGEILITSVDNEGTQKGMDIPLLQSISTLVKVPIIASGGVGKVHHISEAFEAGADAVAIAHALHYETFQLSSVKSELSKKQLYEIRK